MSQNVTLSTNISAAQGVIGPLLEGAEVSDDGDCRRQVRAADVAFPHTVYTDLQMLEKHPQNCHFRHFLGPSARCPGGTARSASCCSITRSDMLSRGPGGSKTECVWVHRNCHTDFHPLYSVSRGSEWHVGLNLLPDCQDQQAGPATDPTCADAWSGRIREGGVRTGSRSRPSGRRNPGESPPGHALRARPARRWHRSPGCGPAGESGPARLEGCPRPIPDRLRNAPRIARAHAGRSEPSYSHAGRGGAIRPPQHFRSIGGVVRPAPNAERRGHETRAEQREPLRRITLVNPLSRLPPRARPGAARPGSSGQTWPRCRGPSHCCRRAPCRTCSPR
jgi:hypothetical protein